MEFAFGSAITLALLLVIMWATVGPSPCRLRVLRKQAYMLSVAIPSLVPAPDFFALAAIAIPAVAVYEAPVAPMG